jgi:hypothetical protein
MAACGNETEVASEVANEANALLESETSASIESSNINETQEMITMEETSEVNETIEYTYEEKNNCFLVPSTEFVYEGDYFMNYQSSNPQDYEIEFVDVEGWPKYAIYDSINLYAGTGQVKGYTKENAICQLCATSEEGWGVIIIDGRTIYIKMDDFEGNSVLVTERDNSGNYIIPEKGETSSNSEASNSQDETTTKVEANNTNKASTDTTQETLSTTPSVDNPSTPVEEVVEETPNVVDNDKYTPEEAVAAYRAIMESNGMTWDPSLPSDGASWGTGWIYLKKSSFEEQVQSALKGYAYGDGQGNPTTRYYFEVTGSDDNKVNVTVWGSH